MKSMTGYAALDIEGRRWELRSVNARGLDLRLRLPDLPGLEPAARKAVQAAAARGNVTLSLRVGGQGRASVALDEEMLDAALAAVARVEAAAQAEDVDLRAATAADVLALRGVWVEAPEAAPDPAVLTAELRSLVADWDADRSREGAALRTALSAHVDEIADLTDRADRTAAERTAAIAEAHRAALARLADAVPEARVPEDRVAQELTVLLTKADVAEEIDRLRAHVAAAREILTADGPVGRRLDFLTQEFNREANTLCAKANLAELTAIGLDLKLVIDRLREQVQNVE
ncbi:YicC/YloC family endoribonuclease [Jannaschia aquimarina]|uniref:YicC family protein n=1 Tax=Jannaschia aquimarina TaxID=935700 RepID=A0A0D1CSR2_9RHOB|nr:YicC/YloC family endoribonuclease [Jannaschia aquimarina]KIT17792.1 hypothetical protein jaqu_04510 [Jannaschia aquimarina]SNT14208.1 TIGR00255 family protein [Jannaschia aquimarina]